MDLSGYYFFMSIYRCAKFGWKIKYAISDAPLAATGPLWNIFFITEWIALKLNILTDIKIRLKKANLFTIGPVVFVLQDQVLKRVRQN
jgi:hypothetical protein